MPQQVPAVGIAILKCRAQLGVSAPAVTIEVLLSGGLPQYSIVGLVEAAVRESKDRVRGAILSSGFEFPQSRITINLGPADMPKSGGRYDLLFVIGGAVAVYGKPVEAVFDFEGVDPSATAARSSRSSSVRPTPRRRAARAAGWPARWPWTPGASRNWPPARARRWRRRCRRRLPAGAGAAVTS